MRVVMHPLSMKARTVSEGCSASSSFPCPATKAPETARHCVFVSYKQLAITSRESSGLRLGVSLFVAHGICAPRLQPESRDPSLV